jgi:isopentenyl-diphosphate delta-isomerase type 1
VSTSVETSAPPAAARAREHVVVVDERGRVLRTIPKAMAHHERTPLHLAFSVHVVRPDGRFLLTRRSARKRTWPGVWSNGCCGHPQLGETLRSAVTRRLVYELGVSPSDVSVVLPDFAYRAAMSDGTVEHELCPVLVARVDGQLDPDPDEVDAVQWVDWPSLVTRAQEAPATLSPWCVEQVLRLEAEDMAAPGSGLPTAMLDGTTATPAAPDPTAAACVADSHRRIEHALTSFLDERERALLAIDDALAPLIDEIRGLVDAGGKRLRPAFAYWGHRATGAAHDDGALGPAAAIELLHTFALLHDDVMDRSATRRGRPSALASMTDAHDALGAAGESGWFGVSAAILAGDLAFALADELFDRSELDAAALRRARRVFSLLRTEVIGGQYLDLTLAADRQALEMAARRVALLKSARYTVTRPLLLGAALAPSDAAADVEPALARYGDAVGMAFQMRDDVLGVFGDPTVTGKSRLDDLREGKRTVLALRALRLADPSGRQLLERSLGRPDLDDADADRCRDVIASSGALASVERLVAAEHERALTAAVLLPEPARSALEHLAAAAIVRLA